MKLTVNGFALEACFDPRCERELLLPLLERWSEMRRARGERLIVFLAAPPGCGKSTLAAYLAALSRRVDGLLPLDAIGLDGFHFSQAELAQRGLLSVKGSPETFDPAALEAKLASGAARWPRYDRRIHDVCPDAQSAEAPILLLEGNWLLLDERGWRGLQRYCDDSLFIHASEAQLKERLILRKMQGGLSRPAAEAFYEKSDRPNIRRALARRLPAQAEWRLLGDGSFERIN